MCGVIRYEITRAPIVVYTCNCTDCQRITSSAFSIGVVLHADAVHLSGEPRIVESVADSGHVKQRLICPNCGIWIGGLPKVGTQVAGYTRVIRAGTLDDTSWVRPRTHYWTRSKQPWVLFPPEDEQCETQP